MASPFDFKSTSTLTNSTELNRIKANQPNHISVREFQPSQTLILIETQVQDGKSMKPYADETEWNEANEIATTAFLSTFRMKMIVHFEHPLQLLTQKQIGSQQEIVPLDIIQSNTKKW